jgi:acetate kinase
MAILVVNAGSSSLKLRLLDAQDRLLASEDLDPPETGPAARGALAATLERLPPLEAVGHRVVHGGTEFVHATRITPGVLARLQALTDLAPLHQPKSLAGIDAVSGALPDVPQVACFDTAFHAGMPAAAATYALPREWRDRWGLRRFGFHGLAHAYLARRAAELIGRSIDDLRLVTCQLGAGASLAAVARGRSVDTTMGFTPLEGLVMATRAGTVDPGLLVWLAADQGIAVADLGDGLERRSGLLGLAGTSDMREVLAAEASGDADARLAVEVYVHRLAGGVAAMAASMGGLDGIVFGGGVGEHAASVRARACERLGFLGLAVEAASNDEGEGDRLISPSSGSVAVLVVETREEIEIARQVRAVIAAA